MALEKMSFVLLVLLVAPTFAAPVDQCSDLIAPSKITSEHKDFWKVILEYPLNNVTIEYFCPKNNESVGIFRITARALGKRDNSDFGESMDIKTYMLTPVPGLNGTLHVDQEIPEMKSNIEIKFDPEGFQITKICYREIDEQGKQKELQPWTKDTPTGQDFPFELTDQKTLRFQMDKCNQ